MSLFKPLCKYCATVTSIRDIAPILRRALQEAQSDTPGPVFVEMPIDVLYSYDLVKREVGVKGEGRGLVNKVVNWYGKYFLIINIQWVNFATNLGI